MAREMKVRLDINKDKDIKGLGVGESVEVTITGVIEELELPREVPEGERFGNEDDGIRTGNMTVAVKDLKINGENEFMKMAKQDDEGE